MRVDLLQQLINAAQRCGIYPDFQDSPEDFLAKIIIYLLSDRKEK